MSASAGPYEVPLKESAGGRKQRRSMPGWASRVCGAVVSTSRGRRSIPGKIGRISGWGLAEQPLAMRTILWGPCAEGAVINLVSSRLR